jgi:sigma-E factor negative regulatory protein RseC
MAVDNKITHTGIIKNVENDKVVVSIVSKASCISCSLKNVCSASDMKEKEIVVDMTTPTKYRPGENVTVELSQSAGNWAVAIGYFFPFLVILVSLIVFIKSGLDQGLAGILSLAMLVPYYGFIYLLKGYFRKRFKTKIL